MRRPNFGFGLFLVEIGLFSTAYGPIEGRDQIAMPRQLAGNLEFQLERGDITTLKVDAVVLPTTSTGTFTSPLGMLLKELGAEEAEQQAMEVAPIAVGAAFVTECEPIVADYLIHVPIAVTPGGKIGVENVRRAARAALVAGNLKGFDVIAYPPLCRRRESGIPTLEIARAVIDEVRGHRHPKPEKIVLIDEGEAILKAARKILNSLK
jgi:O-acetyl-ADP-ribose deacetylase (regulator of RNase III)